MEFDIYALSENEGKGSIKAVINQELGKKIEVAIKIIKKDGSLLDFCRRLEIKYETLWKYLNVTKAIPLFVLSEMQKESGTSFRENIKNLEYGTGATKRSASVVRTCTENLAALIGAYAADGYLKQRSFLRNGRKLTHYELRFREEHASNVDTLLSWIKSEFGFDAKNTKERNHYHIYISNKIIFRHFERLFGFKPGRKTETIRAPDFIKNSHNEIKISFIKGVMMFDGYVNKSNGYIELYSKSENLIRDISNMLSQIGIRPDYISKTHDKYERYRFIIRKQEKLSKCLILFEPNTIKWARLNTCINNFRRSKNGGSKMAKDRTEEIKNLMTQPQHIRNIAIAAHID